jgi:hypothetical protein
VTQSLWNSRIENARGCSVIAAGSTRQLLREKSQTMLAASAYHHGRLKLKSGGRVNNFDLNTPDGRIAFLKAEQAMPKLATATKKTTSNGAGVDNSLISHNSHVDTKRTPVQWVRRGCFLNPPMRPRDRKVRTNWARAWLAGALCRGPKPAAEVFRLAKLEGIPIKGLKRAKRYYKVKSVKTGGRRQGWGAQWIWHFPVSK